MKSLKDIWTVSRAVGLLFNYLEETYHLSFQTGYDFFEFQKITDCLEGKKLSEELSPDFFELQNHNSFWITANHNDKCISIQAARLENTAQDSLGEFWNAKQRRIYELPSKKAKLGRDHSPGSFELKGQLVYHGDMWLSPDFRRQNLSGQLVQLGFLSAYLNFDMNALYGFMSQKGINAGFHKRCGYMRTNPIGTDWIKPPKHIRSDDWLVWVTHEELVQLAKIIVQCGPEHNPYTSK